MAKMTAKLVYMYDENPFLQNLLSYDHDTWHGVS